MENQFKIGDLIVAESYVGIFEVEYIDDWSDFFKETHWCCTNIKHDTIFDSFKEKQMRLATQEEIEEYLNYGKE